MVIQGEEGRARPDAIKGTREGEEGDLGFPREFSSQPVSLGREGGHC